MSPLSGRKGLDFKESLIFERSVSGRQGYSLPDWDVPRVEPVESIPAEYLREPIEGMPEVSEVDVVRHYTRLSRWNYGVDLGVYPLGSCTMKYNPRVNEVAARMPGFTELHPLVPEELAQGALTLIHNLEQSLAEICGMPRVTLQPAAGAQGELTGILMIHAYHTAQGRQRKRILVPDTAHGTNPASSALCGYRVTELKSGPRGMVEPETVRAVLDDDVAAIMLTNPNTLGLFEEHIREIAEMVHGVGGFVYLDGANMNALMGRARPGEMGVDVIQLNLHKTFSTPHGGGGPGSGPVAVSERLIPFLPRPVIERQGDVYRLNHDRPQSIGRVRSFYGNFGIMVRAYTYIRELGAQGLKRATDMAVLNANYIRARLKAYYHLPFDRLCCHECVFVDKKQNAHQVKTMDIAKRLMDFGYHPPTVYFPLVVSGAIMVEPTESESREELDALCEAFISIAKECEDSPEKVRLAPHNTALDRLDEVSAARNPVLRWLP